MWKRLTRLFQSPGVRRRVRRPPEDLDDELDTRLLEVRAKLGRWLVTREAKLGLVKQTSRWSLTKTNQGLYRLESTGISVMISTEPFLVRQKTREGGVKISGLLRMSELGLSGAVHEKGEVSTFFQKAEPVQGAGRELFASMARDEAGLVEDDRPGMAAERAPDPSDLKDWEPFALDQMIVQNSTNTLAHVLVQADDDLERLLRGRLSDGLKRALLTELNSMLSVGGDRALNPHSRVRGLLEFDEALADFRAAMKKFLALENAKIAREKRKQLP